MMARNNQRGSRNNNPEGRNQYSNGWMDTAKDRPMATAAAAAAAVGAGVFLWSRRNQISEQISNLSEQFSDWTSQQYGSNTRDFETADTGGSTVAGGTAGSSTTTGSSGTTRSRGKGGTQGASGSVGTASASTGNGGATGGSASF